MSSSADSGAAAIIAAEAALVQQNYGLTFASTYIGQMLFGIVIAQVYIYYTRYPRDPLWMKGFVLFLFVCDVCSAIFTVMWMYFLFVTNWGQITAFSQPVWLLSTDPIILGFMACATHFFFARRIKIVTKSVVLAGLVCACGIATFAGSVAAMVRFLQVPSLADLSTLRPIAIEWLLTAMLGDILITVILTWALKRKKSGFARTDKLVDRVIRVTIQNGFLTAAVATAALVLYLSTDIPYHLALSLVLPRLYSNSVLSSLNYRDVESPDRSLEQSITGRLGSGVRHGQQTEVLVHVEAHELSDAVTKADNSWEMTAKGHAV